MGKSQESDSNHAVPAAVVIGIVAVFGGLILMSKVAGAMVPSNDPATGDLVIRTRIVNHLIILLLGGLILIGIASLPGLILNELVSNRSKARQTDPPRWLSQGIPFVISGVLFLVAVYFIADWLEVRTEIRVSQVNQTISVRQIHLMHDDKVKSVAFSEIADVRYSEYEDETIVTGDVALILHDGSRVPVMEAGSTGNAKSLQAELQRVLP